MNAFSRGLKRIFLWNYGRSTWQYDVLCVLILAFVFLTPKSWFESSELDKSKGHPNSLAGITLPDQGKATTNKGVVASEQGAMGKTGRINEENIDKDRNDPVKTASVASKVK